MFSYIDFVVGLSVLLALVVDIGIWSYLGRGAFIVLTLPLLFV